MKRFHSALLLAVLALFFISVLLSTVDSAELFTPKDIPGTDMHNNPDALRQISREESANAFGMMQDFIDLSDSIVINLKIKNMDDAKEDLEEYARLASRYDNLIINLDMDDSEIEEFRRNNKEQLEALKETVQDSELLEQLKTLQIQYRESGDSNKFYSVTYEIEALKKKMGIDTARLENSTRDLTESSKKYEVETSHLEESSKSIREIGGDDELNPEDFVPDDVRPDDVRPDDVRPDDVRPDDVRPDDVRPEDISINVSPLVVYYGDLLNISGTVEWVYDEKAVEIFIDSKKAGETGAEPDGGYIFRYPVKKIKAGKHTVYSKTGISYSDVFEFEVKSLPGLLSLDYVEATDESGNNIYRLFGNLTADGIPVSGAAVGLLSGNKKIKDAVTGYDGNFSADISLREGLHIINAVFDNPAYPVDKTESREIQIYIPGSFSIELIVLVVFFSLFFGYSGYYILTHRKDLPKLSKLSELSFSKIRKDSGREEEVNTKEDLKKSTAAKKTIPPVEKRDNSVKRRYLDIISQSGYFEGYHFLISVLFNILAGKYNVSYKKSMTVNEFMHRLCGICERESGGSSPEIMAGISVKVHESVISDTESFIRLYEKLVYQGVYDKGDELSLYHIFDKIIDDLNAGESLRDFYTEGEL
jgi:hypothetical protein